MLDNMFSGAESFDSDLSEWDTSNAADTSYMFNGARLFNGDLSEWNTFSVRYMNSMFRFAGSFDSDLREWDTSYVTDMSSMFCYAFLVYLVNKAKELKSFNRTPVGMNGPKVHCNHQEAMDLDRKNHNNNWTESETMETLQPLGYMVSKNLSHKSNDVAPRSIKMTTLHFVYSVIVQICNPFALLENNTTNIDNTPMPNQQLQNRHLMLSYYYVREALASGDYVYLFVIDMNNQSVILCKLSC